MAIDYGDGIRNHVKVSNNVARFGYKLFIKATAATDQAGVAMAETINNTLYVQGEAGYWPAKTASESDDGQEKPAALFFTFWTKAAMEEIKASAASQLAAKLAPTAGHWNVQPMKITIAQTDNSIELRDVATRFFQDKLDKLAEAGQIHVYGEYDNNIYRFGNLDGEQVAWLKDQLTKLMGKLGIAVAWYVDVYFGCMPVIDRMPHAPRCTETRPETR